MSTQVPAKNGTNGTTAVAVRQSRLPRDPFRSFESMRQLMDAMFENRFPADFNVAIEPAVNVYEKDGTYTLECALPGYKKDDIKIEARGDELSISGSYSRENNADNNHYHRHELRQGSFSRIVDLPQEINPDSVTAKLENGLLIVSLKPMTVTKSKSIPVNG